MNAKAFALAGLAGSFVLAGTASATFLNISLDEYVGTGWSENGYDATGLTTYRLVANFDGNGPNDGILAVSGSMSDILSVSLTGGSYHNALAFAGNTAPTDLTALGIWDNQWDTYVTIGATSDAGDATTVSPGFDTITNSLGGDFTLDNGGWFVTPVDGQAMADGNNQVILAQFAVLPADGNVVLEGVVNILTLNNEDFIGSAFSSVPAPGALALLGLAGVAGTRRRRA